MPKIPTRQDVAPEDWAEATEFFTRVVKKGAAELHWKSVDNSHIPPTNDPVMVAIWEQETGHHAPKEIWHTREDMGPMVEATITLKESDRNRFVNTMRAVASHYWSEPGEPDALSVPEINFDCRISDYDAEGRKIYKQQDKPIEITISMPTSLHEEIVRGILRDPQRRQLGSLPPPSFPYR